jgi:hypothetical protein
MGMTQQLMSIALVALVAIGTPASSVRAAQCCGDCNSNGMVSIDELVSSVNNDLGGCILPLDLRQAFLGSTDVQSCAAKIVAAGFTAGEVETTAAVDSACDVSSCDGSVLAIQHFGSPSGEGRSVVAVVTFHLSGSQPTSVQVVNIPPFNTCAP